MLLRRSGSLALALAAAAACAPSVPKETGPAEVDFALFDPQIAELPQPNDLILAQDVTTLPVPAASRDLLLEFQKAGGFPNDQEVPITIDFGSTTAGAGGIPINGAPDLDLTTITPATLLVFGISSTGGVTPATLDPITDYQKFPDHGTLTIHNKNKQRWTAGVHYVVAVRGGPDGIKLKGSGNPLQPSRTTFLLIQDKNLSLPENQSLIITQLGSRQAAAGAGAQLEQIRKGYLLPYRIIDSFFPHQQLALIQTFQIAPAQIGSASNVRVQIDPNAGLVPLPSNFLLDPANGGKTVINNPAFGPAAAGLATLDGFSTTAMIIALTGTSPTDAIDASTVSNKGSGASVALYDLTDPAAPVLVDPATYEAEPSAIAQTAAGGKCSPATAASGTCFSTVIGLQPAAPATSFGAAAFTTQPLKEATNYAVVITDRVKDTGGKGISRSTVAKILLFNDPLVTVNGGVTSTNLAGVDVFTAGGLEVMRQQLLGVIPKVSSDLKITKDNIALAYVFRTQSISVTALNLGALPYKGEPSAPVFPTGPIGPSGTNCANCIVKLMPVQAFGFYGLDISLVPFANIDEVVEGKILTLNLLDPATGAFRPDPTVCFGSSAGCIEPIGFTLAVPKAANVPACPVGFPAPAGARCAPLVIFRHGINGGRGDMLGLADAFAAQGMVVAAIDAAKHGDRAYCQLDTDCVSPATCVHDPAQIKQGDPAGATPGKCSSATALSTGFVYRPVRCPAGSISPTCTGFDPTAGGGIAKASGNFVISANFFRTRDIFRQDILDQSMLVRTMAPASAQTQHAIQAELGSKGIVLRPDLVYFIGQSLGAMNGTVDVAANPRISKVVLNVGGATIVDTFVNSPSFAAQVAALFTALGATPGTPKFLQTLSVAKWILDPADPINFAKNLIAAPLPNLLTGAAIPPKQAAKKVLGQRAECDQTVPDFFQLLLDFNVGLAPAPGLTPTQTEQLFTTDGSFVTPFSCASSSPPPGAVDHGFLLSFKTPTLTSKAQADAAAFLANDTLPPAVETSP